jgi:DNA repair protein RadA/Sms
MQEAIFSEIRHRLTGVKEIRPSAFTAICPVRGHQKRLYVAREEGVKCQGGCSPEEVVTALGLTLEDLQGRSYQWASAIEPKSVEWTWHPRIPCGHVTDLSGDPGIGKSYLTMSLAAELSLGLVPSDNEMTTAPRKTLLLTAEDDAGAVVRPRLEGMGADLDLIAVVDEVFSLGSGLTQLEHIVTDIAPKLVVIDPLMAYMQDARGAGWPRQVMAGLSEMAERHRCAILVVRHLTKATGGKAIHRSIGSIDFIASVRSALLIGGDPNDHSRRALLHIKSNLAPLAEPIGYTVEDGRFLWTGPSELTIDRLLTKSSSTRSAIDEAIEFLREELADGPKPVAEILAAAKEAGLSDKRIRSARERICRSPQRVAGKEWVWELAG